MNSSAIARRRSTSPWPLRLSALLTVTILALIVLFVFAEAWPALRDIGLPRFFTDPTWHPTSGSYGALPMVVATLATTSLAVAIALPTGLLCAVYANFHAPPRIGRALRAVVELLAGIPSVVYGFWALMTIVPMLARVEPPGSSLLAGALVLAVMILPTVVLVIDQALRELPRELAFGAAALGMSRGAAVWRIFVPAVRRSIGTASILGAARALGETMAVLLVCGNEVRFPSSPFDSVRTLTANIALEMAYALDDHRAALFATGALLLLLVGGLVLAIELIERRTTP
ncbi:MAG: phosphate ABC transporter permease subunit PstC [Planctomycetota bacterium]